MIVLLAIGIFVLFGILLSQSSFDLPFLNPDTNQQLLFFAALSAVIFLLFVALTFVLARNLLKLFAERRLGVLGSKFRTRLVVAGLMLSLLPVIVMFWFTYGLWTGSSANGSRGQWRKCVRTPRPWRRYSQSTRRRTRVPKLIRLPLRQRLNMLFQDTVF